MVQSLDKWQERIYSLDWLYNHIFDYDRPMLIMDWLRIIGVVPNDAHFTRKNSLTKTALDPFALKGGYLAELANDWDVDGETTVREFLDSIEYEIAGSPKNRNVAGVLGDLGR